MARALPRPALAAVAVLAVAAVLAFWPVAGVEVDAGGRCLLFLPLGDGEPLDLTWRHSVDGILVRDRFTRHGGTLYLTASYMPFFAAGLGDIAGRGRVVGTDRHGLAIVDLDEPMAAGLPLRVGSPEVAHADSSTWPMPWPGGGAADRPRRR